MSELHGTSLDLSSSCNDWLATQVVLIILPYIISLSSSRPVSTILKGCSFQCYLYKRASGENRFFHHSATKAER